MNPKPLPWIALHLDAKAEAIDWIRTLLTELADIPEDSLQVLPYHGSATQADLIWDFTVYLYLKVSQDAQRQAQPIIDRLTPLQRVGLITKMTWQPVADRPATSSQPDRLGRFVLLGKDNFLENLTAEDRVLRLTPTLAFGSGLHPATRLSLQLIDRYTMPGMVGLDLGCGSGILAVAMANLGATVLALDNDPIAIAASRTIVQLNQVGDRVQVQLGSLGLGSQMGHWMGGRVGKDLVEIAPSGQFQIIVANILARIHIALADTFRAALQNQDSAPSCLLTAGYTADYAPEVDRAMANTGFTLADQLQDQEWVAQVYQISDPT